LPKKVVIGIAVAVVLVAAIIPVAYATMQRAAITSLQFHFNKFELTDVDFSDTTTSRSIQQIFEGLEDPSETTLTQVVSLQNDMSSITSPEGFVLDMVANTKLTFSMFVDIHNPSSFEAIIDRAQVKVSINNRELPNVVSISQQARIPAGGDTTVELSGITLSGKEIANMLVNFTMNDFVLTLDFVITSYFPTLFGEVPIPANLNLDIFLIPPKPTFDVSGDGFNQVAYNTNSYELTFYNNNPIPLTGKFQVGVMKGNFLSKIGLCDPACIAPIDSGLATYIRINLGNLAGIQVFEKESVSIKQGKSFTLTIDNPDLRNREDSAFIIRWNPDYDLIPYVVHSEMAGIESTSQGEFSSQSLLTVKRIAYNLVRDFGYVGSKEFLSPDKSTYLSLSSSAASVTAGSRIEFNGKLTDLAGNGISNAQIYFQDDDALSGDEYLAWTYTDSDGRYSYSWTAEDTDFFDNTIEVFASYKGSPSYEESRSNSIAIEIGDFKQPVNDTHITITASTYSAYEGDTVIFSGRLTDENGQALANKLVYIEDEDTGSGDEDLGTAYTDNNGEYTIFWTAEDTDFFDDTIEIFASYKGSVLYSAARSQTLDIDILQYQPEKTVTSLSLQSSSYSAYEGDTIEFSGILTTQNGDSISNALIYLKDEDTGSGDDVLGTVTTGSDGSFTFDWDAQQKDPFDNVVEVYALFEGNAFYYDSQSAQIDITVYEQQVPSGEQQFQSTSITLSVSSTSPSEGEIVEFSGTLLDESGEGVAGAMIYIKDEDTGSGDDLISIITTNSNGYYIIEWSAEPRDPFDNVVEVYAVFEGSSLYGSSRSIQINVQVT
jgi:protocatechuate 3,4-dioxygenase beta subunit